LKSFYKFNFLYRTFVTPAILSFYFILFLVGPAIKATGQNNRSISAGLILKAETYRHYIDSFNINDQELYAQYITNENCWSFLAKNIPLFDCPDKQLEQTYYFRWWTYRKHIRKTPEGFVILEFLPDVSWAGKYNTINCAAALHLYEGRWLHDERFLDDYEAFWYTGSGDLMAYSCWMADAIWNRALVTGHFDPAKKLEKNLVLSFEERGKTHLDRNGLFWQTDGADGMEMSVCGDQSRDAEGYRPTINAYMYGDAEAIAQIAGISGNKLIENEYHQKAEKIKSELLQLLWDEHAEFFKVMPGRDTIGNRKSSTPLPLCLTRELHGYSPWLFNLPSEKYSIAWKYLMDPRYFYAPFGPTTAAQSDPGFRISYEGHECQWNGPSWPFATSVTLTALANFLNRDSNSSYITKADYFKLLENYSKSQTIKKDGKVVSWIDENLNPFTGDWISRTRLTHWENGQWSAEKGGVERGKDYNHSTFCDLIITGLVGIRPEFGDYFTVNPLVPDAKWEYFCLDHVLYHGHTLTIVYDKNGNHYHHGQGLSVYIDDKKSAWRNQVGKLVVHLPVNAENQNKTR
jgi:hypothetical protein